ncbi:YkgJ family cysteine cluster protein [Paraburkholderia sp. Ac-20342]|uniref:YkgJ family cysteine cluster protein n=1 Tax=Paraburkholderia sp. Ac-20342 TaxID=2703889 RepID=UPI00197EEBAE|nr:YkgJ family cysteine cluster protein [Paraburkholderia sp. Ac-20342]MBN3845567.1 YkgJ family cysteine cluster protein [Paraburkholderia sp. Ac-20342]
MSQTIHFACTMCGKCCHDLRLPLSIDEAIVWLRDGGEVEFFCEAIPWPEEPPEDNLLARHKRQRSFATASGELPVRIVVNLVASFEGACPFLQTDMRCGAYTKRPRVCRIYPAEVNPFIELDPGSKACPPEAWSQDNRVLARHGVIVDAEIAELAAQSRRVDAQDVDTKARACAALGISTAALANEGFAIHSPDRDSMLRALSAARESTGSESVDPMQWSFVSNRSSTRQVLDEIGAKITPSEDGATSGFRYFAFHAAD